MQPVFFARRAASLERVDALAKSSKDEARDIQLLYLPNLLAVSRGTPRGLSGLSQGLRLAIIHLQQQNLRKTCQLGSLMAFDN